MPWPAERDWPAFLAAARRRYREQRAAPSALPPDSPRGTEAASWLRRHLTATEALQLRDTPPPPQLPEQWFLRRSPVHGVAHAQRVHMHAARLAALQGWPAADTRLVLAAALWHDIGRRHDGVEPSHGEAGVARLRALGLADELARSDATIVYFAIRHHCLRDECGERAARHLPDPERALCVFWLLKDADGLDRVRLGEEPDPGQLRSPLAAESVALARLLLRLVH